MYISEMHPEMFLMLDVYIIVLNNDLTFERQNNDQYTE